MRTCVKGRYCLTANALGAGVRQGAHFFISQGIASYEKHAPLCYTGKEPQNDME